MPGIPVAVADRLKLTEHIAIIGPDETSPMRCCCRRRSGAAVAEEPPVRAHRHDLFDCADRKVLCAQSLKPHAAADEKA